MWAAGVNGAAVPGLPDAVVTRNKRITVNRWNQVEGLTQRLRHRRRGQHGDRRHAQGPAHARARGPAASRPAGRQPAAPHRAASRPRILSISTRASWPL
ncbi:MAG: hypothetical protein WKG07_32990 [Hymenobacter sp.]